MLFPWIVTWRDELLINTRLLLLMSVVSLSLCRAQIMQPLKMVLNIANIVRMFQVMGGQWENSVQVWITMEMLQLYAPLCRISPMYSSCFLTNCRKCCINATCNHNSECTRAIRVLLAHPASAGLTAQPPSSSQAWHVLVSDGSCPFVCWSLSVLSRSEWKTTKRSGLQFWQPFFLPLTR